MEQIELQRINADNAKETGLALQHRTEQVRWDIA